MKTLLTLSILLLCCASHTALAGQWGTMVWGQDNWGNAEVIEPTPVNPIPDVTFETGYPFDAKIAFHSLKNTYAAGEFFTVNLHENIDTVPTEGLDLWIAIESPTTAGLLYMTPFPFTPFSSTPQPFRTNVTSSQMVYEVFNFEIPPGMGGTYNFYAVYMEHGKDPTIDGFTYQRSNLAYQVVTLED